MKFKEFEWVGDKKHLCCDYGCYNITIEDKGTEMRIEVLFDIETSICVTNHFSSIEKAISYAEDMIRNLIINHYFQQSNESIQYSKGYIKALEDTHELVGSPTERILINDMIIIAKLNLNKLLKRKDLIN